MKKFIFISFLIAVFPFAVIGKYTYAQNTNSENQTAQTISNLPKSDAQRMDILETKLDAAEKYNDKILNMVYWATGALGSTILFILGMNYFNSIRNEIFLKNDIKTEVLTEIQTSVLEIQTSVDKQMKSLVGKELFTIKTMRYELVKMHIDKSKELGSDVSVVRASLQLLELAQDRKSDRDILECLEYIKEAIKSGNILESHSRITYLDLTKALDSLSGKFPVEVESIRNILKSKHN